MYIKVTNGQAEPYSFEQLRKDNPQVSFPQTPSVETLAEYDVFIAQAAGSPAHASNEVIEDAGFLELADGTWKQAWRVRPMTEQELAAARQEQDERRRIAYAQEADPLFFKWQRDEGTRQQWLDKVAEIKAR
jgi:hypothetical protein